MDKKPRVVRSGWDQLLKHIREDRPLTTFEVSKICGVVHSTISNWIQEGKLNAYKTAGGHRRIKKDDLLVLLKLYDIPVPKELGEKLVELQPDEILTAPAIVAAKTGNNGNGGNGKNGGNGATRSVDDGRRIMLIVEDDTSVSELIAETVKMSHPDLRIVQAYDGFEAGKQIVIANPSLILLDLILPGLDGFNIVKNIRQDWKCSDAKIIAITGYDTPENREKLVEAGGVNGFLAKPIDINDLRTQVDQVIMAPVK